MAIRQESAIGTTILIGEVNHPSDMRYKTKNKNSALTVLILGGTNFIGRHIAETLLAAGHAVTIFNRGISPDKLPLQVERLRGDRAEGIAGLKALASRTWDACAASKKPRQPLAFCDRPE
jgi:nucleoside-diphosphate-sugar epimerase